MLGGADFDTALLDYLLANVASGIELGSDKSYAVSGSQAISPFEGNRGGDSSP